MCILLAFMFCMSVACAAGAVGTDEPLASAAALDSAPDASESPVPGGMDADPDSSEVPESEDASSATAKPDDEAESSCEPSSDTESTAREGLPEGAAPYKPSTSSGSVFDYTVVGEGTLSVLVDDKLVDPDEWAEDADFPESDVVFVAKADDPDQPLTAVTADGDEVEFEEDPDEDKAWRFTLDEVTEDTEVVLSFGNIVPATLTVLGPGRMSILVDDEWQTISDEEPEFEEEEGAVVRLRATSTQSGYQATYLSIGDTDVTPVMYTEEGPVFEFTMEGPAMDIMVRFLATDTITVEIEGDGSVFVEDTDGWVEIVNGTRLPFDPDSVSAEDPLSFRAFAAPGYQLNGVRYASYPLILTKEESDETASDAPSASPSAEASQAAEPEAYLFTVPDPEDGGILHVTFLSTSGGAVQWLRGSDMTTGISWAIPLGNSTYGVSNVTPGSTIAITPITQGSSAYEQARTLAARFGSAFTAWDISLVNEQGVSYQPTVPALFSLPIPNGYPRTVQGLRMLHIMANGQMTENPIEIRQDPATGMQYISMQVESLSTFVLVNTTSATGTPTPVPTYAATAVPTAAPAASATAAPTAPRTADSEDVAVWWMLCAVCCAAAAAAVCGIRRAGRKI